jgi:hypothetical protein
MEVFRHSLDEEIGLVGGETKEGECERLVLRARNETDFAVLEILLNLCELVLGTGTNNGCAHIIVCFN